MTGVEMVAGSAPGIALRRARPSAMNLAGSVRNALAAGDPTSTWLSGDVGGVASYASEVVLGRVVEADVGGDSHPSAEHETPADTEAELPHLLSDGWLVE